jgi:hypothetical protein
MARPKIPTTTDYAQKQISSLENHILSMDDVEIKFQYFISELIMIRLFAILESSIAEIAYKLATGAKYVNGNTPMLLVSPCASIKTAKHIMRTENRGRTVDLKWSKASYIKESIKYVLDDTDYFARNIDRYGTIISEMSKVRNFITHKNTNSRTEYKSIIRHKYGANLKLQVGAFLLSTKRRPIPNLETYIQASRILLNDIAIGR